MAELTHPCEAANVSIACFVLSKRTASIPL